MLQESIKNSQGWFMACAAYAPGMGRIMAQRAVALNEFDKQLHIIYLANDILLKAKAAQPEGTSAAAGAEPMAQVNSNTSSGSSKTPTVA